MIIRAAQGKDAARCAEIYRAFVNDNWVSFELTPPDEVEMAGRIASYTGSHGWLVAEVALTARLG